MFPTHRPRRLRRDAPTRTLVRETVLSKDDLVLPLFVRSGKGIRQEISSMPGCFHLSPDELKRELAGAREDGVTSFILFGLPMAKDPRGSEAWADDGAVQQGLRAAREELGHDCVLMADVCLCAYTDHGHCGVLDDQPGRPVSVENDATLELLAQAGVSLARAGADVIAPSDMMDGRVLAIRRALDGAGFSDRPILSYAVKYASGFYGPFRAAAESAPRAGDRATYQMDPANVREAVKEALADVDEGADMVMVKPALAYLDVITKVREAVNVPVAAYNVSGEYSMVKAAAARGWIDEPRVVHELLLGMRRAGADFILTYFSRDVARRLR
jgi:porphobilinogen synthase